MNTSNDGIHNQNQTYDSKANYSGLYEYIIKVEKSKEGRQFNYYECLAMGTYVDHRLKECNAGMILFVSKEHIPKLYQTGDLLTSRMKLYPIPDSKKEEAYNWKEAYNRKGILFKTYIASKENLTYIGRETSPADELLKRSRFAMRSRVFNNIEDADAKALIMAMIIGDKSYLSNEIKALFSDSGVMHVLAVSGLHVGIIFLIIDRIFSLAFRLLKRRVNYKIIAIIAVWLYALISGFLPSVVRASFMLTIFSISAFMNHRGNALNILFFTACVLSAFKPDIIFQVSFQLSYSAVAGIILFYPYLNDILSSHSVFLRKLWSLSSVSIAAVIGTFPITTYYFGSFPLYFLVSNLLVVPISGIILCLAMMLILFADVDIMASLLGWFIEILVDFLIYFLEIISALPYSVIETDVDSHDLGLLYMLLLSFFSLLRFPSKLTLYLSMILSLTVLIKQVISGN